MHINLICSSHKTRIIQLPRRDYLIRSNDLFSPIEKCKGKGQSRSKKQESNKVDLEFMELYYKMSKSVYTSPLLSAVMDKPNSLKK